MTGDWLTLVSREGRTRRVPIESCLTPGRRDACRADANAWIKRLRLVRYGDRPMRDRFVYRGDSLWWFTELYLHKTRRLDTAALALAALETACDAHEPVRLVVESDDGVVRETAAAFGAARRLPVELTGAAVDAAPRAWSSYLIGLTARLPRWRPAPAPPPGSHPAVAAFVHTAFWRGGASDGQETYIGPVIDAMTRQMAPGDLQLVGVGPRRTFRARRWWDPVARAGAPAAIVPIERLAPSRALADSIAIWRRRHALAAEVVAGDDVRAAAVVRGVDLWPILQRELADAARLQWPWSARAMDEAGAALDALSPRVVLTYAEAGGWGRALVLEARRRSIPAVGLQHGFIYRHWLNYLHEPDEVAPTAGTPACPIPDRTLVFDDYTRAHLVEAGRFPGETVRVTGSPRLDDLAARVASARAGRDALRAGWLSGAEDRLAVLAAKHSEIAAHLPALMQGVKDLRTVRLVVKPHPAETADVYRAVTVGVANVTIAALDTDLARLLAAADLVVTMNSTVAIDGLVLGVPACVIGLPNNLSPFVEAGAMLGGTSPEEIRAGLRAVLYDPEVRPSLVEAGRRFADRFGMRADGHAADRTAAEILALASAGVRASVDSQR
jgi:hypothetical protein